MPFLDEVAARLVAAGVGTIGSNIFKGSNARIPSGEGANGPYLSLLETGGTSPTRVHNEAPAHTQRPTAQIVSRATHADVARAKAKEAYDALDGLFNVTLSGTFYQKITARQEPTDIGKDGASPSRVMYAFNIDAEKQRS